jgi:hypothetical protein
MVELLACE